MPPVTPAGVQEVHQVQELESWITELRSQHFVVQKLCSGSVTVYRATGDRTSAAHLESQEMKRKGFVPHFNFGQMGSDTLLYVHMGADPVVKDLVKTGLLKALGPAKPESTSHFKYKLVCSLSRQHFKRVMAIRTLQWDSKTQTVIRNCTMAQYRRGLRRKADTTVLSETLTNRGGLVMQNALKQQQMTNSWYDGVMAAMPAAPWFFETLGPHRSTCPAVHNEIAPAGHSTLAEFASTNCGPYGPNGPHA